MPDIIVADDGAVRTIRMNRPEKKNALTLAMYDAMAAAIEDAGARDDIACILLAGQAGGFCAGNDIVDFVEMTKTGAPSASARPCSCIAITSSRRKTHSSRRRSSRSDSCRRRDRA